MAGNIRGIKIELTADVKGVTSALTKLNTSVRSTKSQLRDVEKLLKLKPTSTTLLTQKQKLLGQQIEQTKNKLKELEALQSSMKAQGVSESSEEFMALQREIIDTENDLKSLEKEYEKFGSVGAQQVKAVGEKLQEVGKQVEDFGKQWSTHVTAPLVALGYGSVKTAADFDESMSQVAATMGYTVDELNDETSEASQNMTKLSNFAKEMGETTAFSASEAADALNYMALAGYDTDKSIQMLPAVLDLAAAGGIDLAAASDMVTDAQSALGLSSEETLAMVDQMARTASRSNTSVEQLGDALLTIGATARSVKGGTQELSTVLGVLADNGIKGTEGGTHLRNILLSLQDAAENGSVAFGDFSVDLYDSDGNMRSLIDVVGEMQDGLGDMSQEAKDAIISGVFNKTDLAAVNALLNTSKKRFKELGEEIEDSSGAAGDMAETQLDNLNGQLTLLKSALEGAAISLGEIMMPYIRKAVDWLQKLIDKFNNLSPSTKKIIVVVAAVVAAIGPLLIVIGKISQGIGAILKLAPLFSVAGGKWILAIGAIIAIGVLLYKNWDVIKEKAAQLWAAISSAWESIRSWTVETWEAVKTAISNAITRARNIALNTATRIQTSLATAWENVKTTTLQIWENIKTAISNAITLARNIVLNTGTRIQTSLSTAWNKVKTTTTTVWNAIKTLISNAITNARNKVLNTGEQIWTSISNAWENVKTNTTETWENVKSAVITPFQSMKAKVLTIVNNVKTSLSNAWTSIKARATNAWNSIKSAITKPFDDAKATIDGIISTIKGWFPINLGKIFGGIKIPYFEIDGGEAPWGIAGLGGRRPNITMGWKDAFAKAMDNAYILDGATIFGMMNGRMMQGGESGREIIMSYDKLAEMMGGGGKQTTINVTVNAAQGMDERTLADMVARRIQQTANRRSAVWA